MKCFQIVGVAAASLALVAGFVSARPDCANTKASQVQGTTQDQGTVHTCGLGLVVFGVGGGIFGTDCPSTQVFTPAHQECSLPNPGTVCEPDDDMVVTKRECHCGGLILPIFEIGIPTECVCGPDVPFGTVEDAKTSRCDNAGKP
jgi:hypothetical protein